MHTEKDPGNRPPPRGKPREFLAINLCRSAIEWGLVYPLTAACNWHCKLDCRRKVNTSEVRAAVGGVVFRRPVLVLGRAYDLELLASRIEFSFLDQDVLLGRDQLDQQSKPTRSATTYT